jgi:hypothetical protein
MKECLVITLGSDTPWDVKGEVDKFSDGRPMTFSWDEEDNEVMPITAKYLEEKYKVYTCVIIPTKG